MTMRKPYGYWNLEHTVAECKKLVKEYGDLPDRKKLNEMNMSSLAFAITKNGGCNKIRKMAGLEEIHKPRGYWNLENTVDECRKVVEKYGELPGYEKLRKMNMSSLVSAINNNGGCRTIRKMLGVKEGYKPKGYWNQERTVAECKKVVEKYGELPSQKELMKMKKGYLTSAIASNGGLNKIRKMLGLKLKQMPRKYWSLENTLNECRKVVREYGELPGYDKLRKMKRGSLYHGIARNGGLYKIREMLGVESGRKPEGYWTLENTLAECKKVVGEYGKLPNASKLCEMKMSGLSRAITKNGGYDKIREMIGIQKRNPLKEAIMEYLGDEK